MAINKPFFRIYRPGLHRDTFNNPTNGYQYDDMFLHADERRSMIISARLILEDFEHLLQYVEPHSINENVFSHRIYELLLRTCTEVESSCKGILIANGHHYVKSMNHYKKIEQSSHLSEYAVHFSKWSPDEYVTRPFAKWANGGSLPWYTAYNNVKHNRWQAFQKASLKNLLDAICGLLCIIHSQIGDAVQQVYDSNICFSLINDDTVTVRSFTIKPYHVPEDGKYDFDWKDLESDPNRFQCYPYQ